ncbi:MAG: hypothetical protein ABIO61_04335 [Thermomonas sp.]
MNSMPRAMPILIPAMLLLAACAPTTTEAVNAPRSPVATTTETGTPPPVERTEASPNSKPAPAANAPTADSRRASAGRASISGAIRDGNRPPPALRVCATPVGGGTATCIETQQGAREYRIDVAPGRYYLLGWVQSGELKLIAHASQIRCIRAPCPPDELIEVSVAEGQQLDGIDLGGGYADIPAGWPQRSP